MDMSFYVKSLRKPKRRSCGDCVLVADPSMDETSPIVVRLAKEGYEVCIASTIAEVAQIVSGRTIKFALTELHFADGDARSVVRTVKDNCPLCRVIVYSVSCSFDAAVTLTKAGISDMVPKPADPKFLAAIVTGRSLSEQTLGTVVGDPFQLRADYILDIYLACEGSSTRAARKLSMHRRTLERFVRRKAPDLLTSR